MENRNKYKYMDKVLQPIINRSISISTKEFRRNKKVLEQVLATIIKKMKQKDSLFKRLFSRVFYGGSVYDRLKIGKLDEFDLDLLMKLPKATKPTLTNSNMPGFVHLQLREFEKWKKTPQARAFAGLADLLDSNHYLSTTKVSAWMEGIIKKALNDFPQSGDYAVFNTSNGRFRAKMHKGGPAHTLKLSGTVGSNLVVMDVDLVPCFAFTKDKWPPSPYRSNPVHKKPDFFIVPKSPKEDGNVERYWRLSFQEQERVLFNKKYNLRPTLRLMKKLRDNLDHKIVASYFIKTVFLWEVANNNELWTNSLSYVFMAMLKKYKQYFDQEKIPYFWNRNHNLMEKANPKAIENIANTLNNIINDIEMHPNNPYVVAKYFEALTQNTTFFVNTLTEIYI